MNKKHQTAVSVVVPATNETEVKKLISDFLLVQDTVSFCLQVIVLWNLDDNHCKGKSLEGFDNLDIIELENKRYFSSCEENLYRVEDVLNDVGDYIFFVGCHDQINWGLVDKAVKSCGELGVDVAGWNILNSQKTQNGTWLSLAALDRTSFGLSAEVELQKAMAGEPCDSRIIVPSLLAVYGPIDWFAYLGNHLFSKKCFYNILSHSFTEYVYSLVFKIILELSKNHYNYLLVSDCIIERKSEEFLEKQIGGKWLKEHRLDRGTSPTFHLALLYHLNSLDQTLFDLTISSLCYSHRNGSTDEVVPTVHVETFIIFIIREVTKFISHHYSTSSYYCPGKNNAIYVRDLRQCGEFFARLNRDNLSSQLGLVFGVQLTVYLKQCERQLKELAHGDFLSRERCQATLSKVLKVLVEDKSRMLLINEASLLQSLKCYFESADPYKY